MGKVDNSNQILLFLELGQYAPSVKKFLGEGFYLACSLALASGAQGCFQESLIWVSSPFPYPLHSSLCWACLPQCRQGRRGGEGGEDREGWRALSQLSWPCYTRRHHATRASRKLKSLVNAEGGREAVGGRIHGNLRTASAQISCSLSLRVSPKVINRGTSGFLRSTMH